MNPAYLAVGLELLDRLLAWKALQDKVKAEGREISDSDVDDFVAEYGDEKSKLEAAIARARAEGR